MRRKVILVLLGIIFISTLSSHISNYVQIDSDKVLLDTVVGSVEAGNFSYWQLGHTGPILVELVSLNGDADLYVSDTSRPSYEVDRNNFSSVTCGTDVVEVPADFPRPVGIGVFGHWTHVTSEYSIQVYQDVAAFLQHPPSYLDVPSVKTESDRNNNKKQDNQQKRVEDTKYRFPSLLSILDVMFEIFAI